GLEVAVDETRATPGLGQRVQVMSNARFLDDPEEGKVGLTRAPEDAGHGPMDLKHPRHLARKIVTPVLPDRRIARRPVQISETASEQLACPGRDPTDLAAVFLESLGITRALEDEDLLLGVVEGDGGEAADDF